MRISLRNLIWLSFTIASMTAVCLMGRTFYGIFSDRNLQQSGQARALMLQQINSNLSSYLGNMMDISDVLYNQLIKVTDLQKSGITEPMRLLYDSNQSYIKNIALYTAEGDLVTVVPEAETREDIYPEEEDWFRLSLEESENQHFSAPHVQPLFRHSGPDYEWVISLSRSVQITEGGKIRQGVLLIDLKYSGLAGLLGDVSIGEDGYIYIVAGNGDLVYHPIRQQMRQEERKYSGKVAREQKVGTFVEKGKGFASETIIKKVGYTGWYLVGSTLTEDFQLSGTKGNLMLAAIFLLFGTILVLLNSFVSSMVTKPFQSLEQSVGELEKGNLDTQIQVSGVYEVYHLGKTLQSMAGQIGKLMQEMVAEQEEKRRSELDSLQAQINPHFLYNTLDVIVWMISNEQKQEAAKAVMALARFFRISLSRGKNIISVKHEMEHVKNYLIIQKMRFKNRFTYVLEAEPEAESMASIKLILQPLVENAIYHGMEYMDGDGEIRVEARLEQEGTQLVLSVRDNGPGMTKERVREILDGKVKASDRGSGIGISNVNRRIRLYFGESYGLSVWSEPDEGTEMTLRMPAVPYLETEDK